MIIYDKSDNLLLDIPVDDTSYRYRAIRQGGKVYLYFSLTEHVTRNIEYAAIFGGWWELLNTIKYKHLFAIPIKLMFHREDVTEPVYQLDDNGQKVIGEDLDGDGKPVHRVCKFNN